MADTAHYQTDEKLEEMEKRLSAIYSRAEKEIGERWKEYLAESQAEIDELQKAYELAKKSGDAKEIRKAGKKLASAKRERTLMDKRFKALTETTAAQLANVNKTALAYINGQLPEVYSINYNALEQSVDGVGGYSFSLVDADTVKNLATTDKSLLPYKQLDEKTDIRWNVKKMNAEVLQGILQGESMDKIASRLSKVTDMNEKAAIRNARTMVTSAENKGRQDSYARAEADGIILAKEWVSTNDSRTRHSHAELDGATVDQDKKFDNGLMYPGDPSGRPEETWNCRCTVAAVVKGFKKAQVEEAMDEKQAEEPQIATREQAYKALKDDIGFASVEDNVSVIDEKLLVENVKQLKKLNDRFGALTSNNSGYFSASSEPNTLAYIQGNFSNLNHQSMSLCGNYYGKGYDYMVSKEREHVSTNWSMPCLDENLPIYSITHEYGHILENKVIQSRVDMDVFEQAYRAKMLENNGTKKARDFREKEETKQAKTIWKEIAQIAKEENPDFLISQNISGYGKTNYLEAFAETFANSQCGSPNELGKAMNIWLERNGY